MPKKRNPSLLAGVLSAMAPQPEWPEMDRAITHLSKEMPAEVDMMRDRRIRPMNPLERLVFSRGMGAAAMTTTGGNIAYNRDEIEKAGYAPEDVLAHELVHVGQQNRQGRLKNMATSLLSNLQGYGDRGFEQEAFARQESRAGMRKRMHDIQLPSPGRGK